VLPGMFFSVEDKVLSISLYIGNIWEVIKGGAGVV